MRGSGGTEGGLGKFALGFALAAIGLYMFLHSVHVNSGGSGWMSGMIGGRSGHSGWWETTSTGIVFVPFLAGVVALFYDASMRWAWWLMNVGLAMIVVEILSRVRFVFNIRVPYLLVMMVLFAAGVGLILRSYRDESPPAES